MQGPGRPPPPPTAAAAAASSLTYLTLKPTPSAAHTEGLQGFSLKKKKHSNKIKREKLLLATFLFRITSSTALSLSLFSRFLSCSSYPRPQLSIRHNPSLISIFIHLLPLLPPSSSSHIPTESIKPSNLLALLPAAIVIPLHQPLRRRMTTTCCC